MFSYIKGELIEKGNGYVVIDVSGIGYKIYMSNLDIIKLDQEGESVKVHTYFYVREDIVNLYGFISKEELSLFELLISVSGIGAKSALQILSSIEPSEFAIAVITNDIKALTKLPGIGNKSAQRIVLELKDKLKENEDLTKDKNIEVQKVDSTKNNDAVDALEILGYSKRDIDRALKEIDIDALPVEDIIKKALKLLSR